MGKLIDGWPLRMTINAKGYTLSLKIEEEEGSRRCLSYLFDGV